MSNIFHNLHITHFQEKATSGLVILMRMFADAVYFFINSWTWGYEDVLKAIYREFSCPIHVDRYKYSVYQHTSDPFLRSIITQDPSSTRFHACERFHRCEYVAVDDEPGQSQYNSISHLGKRVVYINPVNMGSQSWDLYVKDTQARLSRGEEIHNLLVPLSRHSPLNELRDFVALFQPHRVIPNTLDPRLHGFDWAAIDRMFADCLNPDLGTRGVILPGPQLDIDNFVDEDLAGEDVTLRNLVGEGAADAAERWAENPHLKKKLEILSHYLDPAETDTMARVFGLPQHSIRLAPSGAAEKGAPSPPTKKGKERVVDSEDETDNGWSDDEQGKTAHRLFAGLAGIEGSKQYEWWVSSPAPSQNGEDERGILEQMDAEAEKPPTSTSGHKAGPSVPWMTRLTPASSPVRLKRQGIATVLRYNTPGKRRMTLDKSPPLTPTSRPSKRPAHETKGDSLASPICLSSSPVGAAEILRGRPYRRSTSKKSNIAPRSTAMASGSRLAELQILTTVHPSASRVEFRDGPHTPIASTSRLPFSSPPTLALSCCPLVDVNNLTRQTDSPFISYIHGSASKEKSIATFDQPSNSIRALTEGQNLSPPPDLRGGTNASGKKLISHGSPTSSTPLHKRCKFPSPKPNSPARTCLTKSPLRRAPGGESPQRRRQQLQTQRLRIAERPAAARPDLVVPSYAVKRTMLLGRSTGKAWPQPRLDRGGEDHSSAETG
ncbi:hypothetical protein D9615_006605 [Tricholomella constricta]|uniref:DNA repair metallo-beta-lactamase domain-containing protein n=1 Tax=Tricholomella constricta TaxID=117010 RepID=A0A8H5H9U3_9AGAR|nr:hypothetical protein D9615_006605 [Tricholomella constricta]